MMGEPTKEYKPYDWTIDLGYSYMIGNGLAAYATELLSSAIFLRMPTAVLFGGTILH